MGLGHTAAARRCCEIQARRYSLKSEDHFGGRPMRQAVLAFIFALLAGGAFAQDFRALARVLPHDSAVMEGRNAVTLSLALSQSVPFRVALNDEPRRLVIEAREVDWAGLAEEFAVTDWLAGATIAPSLPGWTRLEVALAAPLAIDQAHMETDAETGAARIEVRLQPVSDAAFASLAETSTLSPMPQPPPEPERFVVALDPGHGGVDPGAEAEGLREAELMLTFGLELAEALLRTGEVEVVLTRRADVFVSLPERISIARAAEADVFVSLHADALAQGRASGATVYTLSENATDAAAASLAEQHDRADLLQGVDLSATDDAVADILMELSRRDTAPRAENLADQIVASFEQAGIPLHPQPRPSAGFSVLRAADIPSVLLEVGFMSNPSDLERIRDATWRAEMQSALVRAILAWAEADRVTSELILR